MNKKISLALLLLCSVMAANAQTLSLHQVERLALQQSPSLHLLQSKSEAFSQDAVASKQWRDPKLMIGVSNIPTNTFSFNQENMTQIQVGLMQQLPKGSTLSILSSQNRLRSTASIIQKNLMKLYILRTIRIDWVNDYYWQQAVCIYKKEEIVFKHLQEVNAKLLENNQLQQKDLVRTQFELSQLQQKIIYAQQQQDEINSDLMKWLASDKHKFKLTAPTWPSFTTYNTLKQRIKFHPVLLLDYNKCNISKKTISLAKQQYIPGVNLGVVYGIRQGKNSMGKNRSNFIGAQATMNLPVFTKNRQSRTVKANKDRYAAAEMQKLADYRQLRSQLHSNYSSWFKLSKQYKIYRKQLMPEAKHYASATKVSYENKQTDFATLARSYILSYNTELSALKTSVSLMRVRIRLLYLQGL